MRHWQSGDTHSTVPSDTAHNPIDRVGMQVWPGDSETLIDRFDVRTGLDYLPPPPPETDEYAMRIIEFRYLYCLFSPTLRLLHLAFADLRFQPVSRQSNASRTTSVIDALCKTLVLEVQFNPN